MGEGDRAASRGCGRSTKIASLLPPHRAQENRMKRMLVTIITATGLALGSAAHAQVDAKKAEATAKELGCLACHAVGSKKVGPAFKEVAKKYKGAPDKLVADLKASKDHTDAVKDAKDADLKLVASWIASL
jgi:cytochrome c